MKTAIATIMLLAAASPLPSAPTPAARAKVLDDVLGCRAEADGGARLACFDRTTASLGTAAEHQDVVVVDREQMQQARRSLFGFSLPRLPILGFGGKDDAEPAEVTVTIRSVRRDREGLWVLTTVDGAVWHQTDQTVLRHDPRADDAAVIRHGALGTYFVRVAGQIGFRARRES